MKCFCNLILSDIFRKTKPNQVDRFSVFKLIFNGQQRASRKTKLFLIIFFQKKYVKLRKCKVINFPNVKIIQIKTFSKKKKVLAK